MKKTNTLSGTPRRSRSGKLNIATSTPAEARQARLTVFKQG